MIQWQDVKLMIANFIPGLTIKGTLDLSQAEPNTQIDITNLPDDVQQLLPMFFRVYETDIIGIRWPMGLNEQNVMQYRFEWWEMDESGRKRKRFSYELPNGAQMVATIL